MLKKLMIATAALGSLALAAPVFAHDGHRGHGRGHFRPHVQHFHPRPVFVAPPRVVYAPAPRIIYAPPPRVVYAPPPVIYPAAPVYHAAPVYGPAPESSVSIRLHFPL